MITHRPTSIATKHARLDLEANLRACDRCTLCWVGNGPVTPIGPTPNDVMVIGEAPTRNDTKAGEITHSGEPGQLLVRVLSKAGFDPADLFYVNTVSCWPGVYSTATYVKPCLDNLRAQIKLCDPKVVITLGAVALDAIKDRKLTVTKDHGKPFRPLAGPLIDRWVVPTWHPAAVSKHADRNKGALTKMEVDLVEAARLYQRLSSDA